MKINQDHLYHGAALTQVAEHPTFKAINELSLQGVRSRCAFLVNTDIGLYLKYATKPKGPFDEFIFTFHKDNLAELQALKARSKKLFICLICVSALHICCITYEALLELLAVRKQEKGSDEDAYTILVTAPANKSFRIYMNAPGRRKVMIGQRIVARDDFPDVVFQDH